MNLIKVCKDSARTACLVAFAISALLSSRSEAQKTAPATPNYKFSHFSSKDGLPQNSVLAIFQDEKGFLWMGTDNGLARFDGFQFRSFLHYPTDPNSITSNVIRAISADKHHLLWIGTEGGGINVFDPKTEKFYKYEGEKGTGTKITSTKISTVFLDQSGNIWIGTLGEGLFKLSGPNSDFTTVPDYLARLKVKHFNRENSSLKDDRIWTVYQGRSGQLYIGTMDGGGYQIDPDNSEFLPIRLGDPTQNIASVKSFFEDDNKSLWIGTEEHGLWIGSPRANDFKFISLPKTSYNYGELNLNITSIRAVGSDQIWVGTLGSGLYILSTEGEFIHRFEDNPSDPYSLKGNSVYTTFQDENQNIWLGMYSGEGLNKVNPTQQQFEHYRYDPDQNAGLSSKMVKTIFKDNFGHLWVGLFNGGVNIMPVGSDRFEYLHAAPSGELSHIHVQTITQTRDGKIWIGTDGGGINVINTETDDIKYHRNEPWNNQSLSKNDVWAIAEAPDGMVWIGTANGGGLNRLDPATGKIKRYSHIPNDPHSPSFDDIRSLLFDSKGNLWIGTYGGGLNQMNGATGTFKYWRNDPSSPNSLSNDIITSLLEDTKGNIWIGTSGGGLNRLDPKTNQFTVLTEKDGLPSDIIKAILQDNNGQLWISTVNGLSAFSFESGMFKNYTEDDGLQSNEFNLGSAFKDKSGKLYFGGTNGFNSFYPDRILPAPAPNKPVFTRLRIFNQEINPLDSVNGEVILQKSISYTENLLLNYSQNNFEFEFSSFEFAGQNQLIFSYQLDGYDKNWISSSVGRRFATYTSLSYGEYVFKVRSRQINSLEYSPISEMRISIVPPWYLTLWAYALYLLATLALVYAYIQFLNWRMKLRNDLRFERLEKEQQEELGQLKMNFFSNISHELRTPLMLITAPLEKLAHRYDLPDSAQREINSIHTNAKRLLQLINQLLDFRKIETGNLTLEIEEVEIRPFFEEICQAFDAVALERKLKFQLEIQETIPATIWIDPEQIRKVMFNLIYNAFKATSEGGTVTVGIEPSAFHGNIPTPTESGMLITVTDNGIGIPKEHLNQIYDYFYQIKREGQGQEIGSGIGLTLSKSIVDLHSGILEARSEGGLTSFKVFLPLRNGQSKLNGVLDSVQGKRTPVAKLSFDNFHKTLPSKKSSGASPRSNPELAHYKVMVVEDNPELLDLIKTNLEETFTVITATNGKDAWNLIGVENPNLIISDVTMPIMDGIELSSKIKQDINTSHLPVILLTAKSSHLHQMEGYQSGADDYLVKPFQLDLLALKVKNLLSTRAKFQLQFARTPNLEPIRASYTSTDQKFLEAAMQTVEKNMDNTDFSVNDFVKELGLSRTLIFEKFKALSGLTPNDFIQTVRLKRAAQLMVDSDLKVAEIGYSVGFSNPKYFSKCFLKQFGKSPTEYKKEHK